MCLETELKAQVGWFLQRVSDVARGWAADMEATSRTVVLVRHSNSGCAVRSMLRKRRILSPIGTGRNQVRGAAHRDQESRETEQHGADRLAGHFPTQYSTAIARPYNGRRPRFVAPCPAFGACFPEPRARPGMPVSNTARTARWFTRWPRICRRSTWTYRSRAMPNCRARIASRADRRGSSPSWIEPAPCRR